MRLCDRGGLGRAINFAGRGMDDALYLMYARGLKNVSCARDIYIDIRKWSFIRMRNRNKGRKMKHHIVPFDETSHHRSVANISADDTHIRKDFSIYVVEPPVTVEAGVERQSCDVGTFVDKRFGEIRADEAIG